MTAGMAASPSPVSSTPIPAASKPSEAQRHREDPSSSSSSSSSPSSSRQNDPSATTASSISAPNVGYSTSAGTFAQPIDLASPPPTTTSLPTPSPAASVIATRPDLPAPPSTTTAKNSHPSSSSSTASTPLRTLPSTPYGANLYKPSIASPSTPSKSIRLPTPYKAPRLIQSGASESFATAYPTQETRQKYASPSKPLPSVTASTGKRPWQASSASDDGAATDQFSKKSKPTGSGSPAHSGSSAATELNAASTRTGGYPAPSPPTSVSNGVTVTGIPQPGSSLSNQIATIDLKPSVSGSGIPAFTKDEYLSLLQKSELVDLVKHLETQLLDLLAAPVGASTLYRQARIYPQRINLQIDKLKARQRIEDAKQAVSKRSSTSATNLSLQDVYSILQSSKASLSTTPKRPGNVPASTASNRHFPSGSGSRSVATAQARRVPNPAANNAAHASKPSVAASSVASSQSLNSLIDSINAMVRQQAQPARGPTGAPLPPAQSTAPSSIARPPMSANVSAHTGTSSSTMPALSQAALKSIVGDGPMPSNAALAAAIAAHFGGSLPNRPGSSSATSTASRPAASSPEKAASSSGSSLHYNSAGTPKPLEGPGKDISDRIAAILGSTATAQIPMLGPQGIPLAPAAAGDISSSATGSVRIGDIAALLSNLTGPGSNPASSVPSWTPAVTSASASAVEASQNTILSSLLQQLEEAKKVLPAQTTSPSPQVSHGATTPRTVQDPVAILTGASANPLFAPTYTSSASSPPSPAITGYDKEASWSPEPEPVIVQGPLGTSTLPSYEDMIVEGLRVMGDSPPRTLFNWMQDTYPLMKNFRPSASQALQKAFKRGRLLKTGSMYRINPAWGGAPEARKPTRRPQVGKDHPMVTPGLNGEVLAVSPLKDSQAYRNVGDSRLKTSGKGVRSGPKPYGTPGADPLPNPASSIFQNGSMASIILEYQKRTGKKLDADSIKSLYQKIRARSGNASADEILADLLIETGYHAAAAAFKAASSHAAAPNATTLPSAPAGSIPRPPVSTLLRPGPATAVAGGRASPLPVPRGPTSLPLPTTSEPTMMQQLARMLNDLSSPINPALANSLLNQLSSNAASAAASQQARIANLTAPPAGESDLVASALSAASGGQPQQDLDSAVSETLAAALEQIGATSAPAPAPAPTATTSSSTDAEAITAATGASTKARPATLPEGSEVSDTNSAATTSVHDRPEAAAAAAAAAEGVDLADYQDAIRALTSAFGTGEEDDADDNEESDEEADEKAIADAEADPEDRGSTSGDVDHDDEDVSRPAPMSKRSAIRQETMGGSETQRPPEPSTDAQAPAQSQSSASLPAEPTETEVAQTEPDETMEESSKADDKHDDDPEGAGEEEDEEDGEDGQMDLSAVLRQLTASLQAHNSESSGEAASASKPAAKEKESLPQATEQEATQERGDHGEERMDSTPDVWHQDAGRGADNAEKQNNGEAEDTHNDDGRPADENGQGEEANLQSQLEALVASLAANANGQDDDDDDDDDDDEDDTDDDEDPDEGAREGEAQ